MTLNEVIKAYQQARDDSERRLALSALLTVAKAETAKRREEGWEDTPDGFLPPEEIAAAGYVWRDNAYFIPTQSYINASSSPDRRLGDKYIGVAKQYLEWRERCKIKHYGRDTDTLVDAYIEAQDLN